MWLSGVLGIRWRWCIIFRRLTIADLRRDSAKVAVAFLERDSAIPEQAQMALAALSVHASSVLLSLFRRWDNRFES